MVGVGAFMIENAHLILEECTIKHRARFSYAYSKTSSRAHTVIKEDPLIFLYLLYDYASSRILVSKLGPKVYLPIEAAEYVVTRENMDNIRDMIDDLLT